MGIWDNFGIFGNFGIFSNFGHFKDVEIVEDIEDVEDIKNAEIAVNAEDIEDAGIVSISQILDMYVHMVQKGMKEAPIYFSNIFISFLGLAYYTPLGCLLRFNFFWQFYRTNDPFAPENEKGQWSYLTAKKNLNLSEHPKGGK